MYKMSQDCEVKEEKQSFPGRRNPGVKAPRPMSASPLLPFISIFIGNSHGGPTRKNIARRHSSGRTPWSSGSLLAKSSHRTPRGMFLYPAKAQLQHMPRTGWTEMAILPFCSDTRALEHLCHLGESKITCCHVFASFPLPPYLLSCLQVIC